MNVQVDAVREFVAESFRDDLGIVLPSGEADFFEELGVDSLAYLNVISRVERRFGVHFELEVLPLLRTRDALAGAVLERIGAG